MSIQAANQIVGLTGLFGKTSQTLTFPSFGEGSMRLGDIIRMRVMRQVGDQRYSMQFKGVEHVVDSSIPFTSGDVLYGKVIGLGSRIEVERIRVERGEDGVGAFKSGSSAGGDVTSVSGGESPFVRRLQLPLTPSEAKEVEIIGRSEGKRELAMTAALALRNIGFKVSGETIRLMLLAIGDGASRGLFALDCAGVEDLPVAPNDRNLQTVEHAVQTLELAPLIKKIVENIPEGLSSNACHLGVDREGSDGFEMIDGEESGRQGATDNPNRPVDPARWLFNAESGSCITHRINTVPLLVNGRLIELNLSLFEEHFDSKKEAEDTATRYRSIALSMNTPVLGKLELRIAIRGRHLAIQMTADREEVAELFAASSQLLRETLAENAWNVAEMNYRHGSSDTDAAGHAVLLHLANLDRYELYV